MAKTKKAISLKSTNNVAGVISKRIGQTTYRVKIYFNQTSRETMDEKIIRIIRNEAAVGKAVINL